MKISLLTETARIPSRKNANDAGLDLYFDGWVSNEHQLPFVPNGEVRIAKTGVTIEIPVGYFGWITNKSGSELLIGGGIVDQGYQGELLVKIINPLDRLVRINVDKGIAQFLILPCAILPVEMVGINEIHQTETTRGKDGGIAREGLRLVVGAG